MMWAPVRSSAKAVEQVGRRSVDHFGDQPAEGEAVAGEDRLDEVETRNGD